MMTYFGEGVPRDRSKGIEMLTKSIASGDVNAMAYLGGIYWDTAIQGKELEPKQSTEMVELLTRAGNFDHPRAIQNLGALYWTGIGVDQCKDKAIELATKAAILDNQNAIQDLTRPAYMKYQEKNKTRTTTINQCAQCHKPLDAKKLTEIVVTIPKVSASTFIVVLFLVCSLSLLILFSFYRIKYPCSILSFVYPTIQSTLAKNKLL